MVKLIEKDVLTCDEMEDLADDEEKKGGVFIRTTDEKLVKHLIKFYGASSIWTELDGEDDKIFYGHGWHLVNRTGQWFVLLKETEAF